MNTFEKLDKMIKHRNDLVKEYDISIINKKLLKYGRKNMIDESVLKYLEDDIYIFLKCYEFLRKKLEKLTNKDVVVEEHLKELSDKEFDNKNVKYIKHLNFIIRYIKENDIIKTIMKNKFKLRQNQKEAIDKLYKNGLETGIHCQATGCGKSVIILKYIEYVKNKIVNPKIILFTERVSIFKDLFSLNKKDGLRKKIKYFKNKFDCDISGLNIIDRVMIKKDWVEKFNDIKPTLLIINRAYLKSSEYEAIEHLDLVLHDECHNTSSENCYNFLNFCKEKESKIVGFSATPLRTGKNDIKKVSKIYSDNKKSLNLLTDYSLSYALEQKEKLLVEPEFHWYQFEIDNSEKNKKILDSEIKSFEECLSKVFSKMKTKKIVAWCGTIKNCETWKRIFNDRYTFEDFEYYIDHSKTKDSDSNYNKFRDCKKNAILFCANKHREGSDIPYLECCIFLDKVKNRGSIPFIQSIGRVLRVDNRFEKKKGYVIDGVKKVGKYEQEICEKIFGYYTMLHNISNVEETKIVELSKEIKILDDVIDFKYGKQNIKIYCNKVDFSILKKNVSEKIISFSKKSKYDILNNIDFTSSKIQECKIDNINIIVSKYRPLSFHIYKIINDKEFIIKNTIMNFCNGVKEDKGYNYMEEYDLSFQYKNSTKDYILIEIITMCKKYGIKLNLLVKTKDENIYNINVSKDNCNINKK